MNNWYLMLILPFLLDFGAINAQQFYTQEDQSPIIKGTKAFLEYRNKEDIAIDIPEELMPLLAGLLLTNEVELEKCQDAISTWIDKYQLLSQRISGEPDPTKKSRARQALKAGSFGEVEEILNLQTDYSNLSNIFPNMFQNQDLSTSGTQSPIIIGDQATVSYVVTKVINYKLPEKVSKNLLVELKNERRLQETLRKEVVSKDQLIAEWVKKYRKIEEELKNTPGELAKEAYRYFSVGDLDKAMEVLRRLDGSKEEIAKASYLQAKIMLLQFDNTKFDSLANIVLKCYKQAASLSEDFEMHRDYAIYLAEGVLDYQSAYVAIREAKKYIRNEIDKVQLLAEEAYVLYAIQNYGDSEKISKEILDILDQPKYQQDTLMLFAKSSSQTNVANCLAIKAGRLQPINGAGTQNASNLTKYIGLIQQAVHYDSLALMTMDSLSKYCQSPEQWRTPNRFVCLSNLAVHTSMVADVPTTLQVFEEVLDYMEGKYEENKFLLVPKYVSTLLAYGTGLTNIGNTQKAQEVFETARDLLKQVASSDIQSSYTVLRQVYVQCMNIMLLNCEPDKALKQIEELLELLNSYLQKNPEGFTSAFQELEAMRVWLLHRLGKAEEGGQLCQQIVGYMQKMTIPGPQFVQSSVNALLSIAEAGFWSFYEQAEPDSARIFIESIYPLLNGMRSNGIQFHTYIDCNKLNLDVIKAAALYEEGNPVKARDLWHDIREKSSDLFKTDPYNAMIPFLYSVRGLARYHFDKGNYKQARFDLEGALGSFQQLIPQNVQVQFSLALLMVNNDLLKIMIQQKDFEKAETLAAQLLAEINYRSSPQSEVYLYNTIGARGLDNSRKEEARGYLIQCQLLEAKGQKIKSKKKRKVITGKIPALAARGLERICPSWKDKKLMEVKDELRLLLEKYQEEKP